MEERLTDRERMLKDAHRLLQLVLDLLDGAAAPAQIGAHIDLAAHQLGGILPADAATAEINASGQAAAHP